MLDRGKRLVVFDLRRHLNAPEWLLRFEDLVEGHDMVWEEREVDYATLFEDRQRKGLSFYTGLRFLGNVTGGGDDEARLFCFPLEEGVGIELTPSVPGYRVEPVSIRVTGQGDKKYGE